MSKTKEEYEEEFRKYKENLHGLRDFFKDWHEGYDKIKKDMEIAKKFKELKDQEEEELKKMILENVEPRREKLEDEKKIKLGGQFLDF